MGQRKTGDALSWRSCLFVPGDRPERFGKAVASGADAVIIDLEDAVPLHKKDEARAQTLSYLRDANDPAARILIRINSLRTRVGIADMSAILEQAARGLNIAGIVVPKACAAQISLTGDLIADAGVTMELGALVETCAGIEDAFAIAKSAPSLSFLMFGGADLAAELGVEIAWDPLLAARARLVQAAASAGLASLDMPWIDLADEEGEKAEMQRSFALGFTGRAAIHPRQIAGIHAALTPSPAALEHARRVIEALEASGGGACLLDGKLIERPIIERSRRLLARAGIGGEA